VTPVSVLGWFAALGGKPQPVTAPTTASEIHLLHRRLEHARLARMLRHMHVSPDVYLQRLHLDQLREQLDACAACPHTFQCDQALACARTTEVNLSFCPNRDSIRSAQVNCRGSLPKVDPGQCAGHRMRGRLQ